MNYYGTHILSEIAAKIEFLTLTEIVLNGGQTVNMAQLEEAYECICCENNVQLGSVSRKSIKELIQRKIGVEFHKQRQVNKPEVVSVKQSRDGAIQLSIESMNENASSKMKTLYDAALILRNAINKSDPWVFSGSLDTPSEDHCPVELSCFFRWIIQGPNTKLSHEDKCSEVQKRAMHLVQSTLH